VRRLETMNALSESARLQREECASLRKQSELLQEKIKCLLEETSAAHAQTRRFEEKAGALQVSTPVPDTNKFFSLRNIQQSTNFQKLETLLLKIN